MDQILAAIQQAALQQQQMCNAASIVGMQTPFQHGSHMNFVGGDYGYGSIEAPAMYPLNTPEKEDEDEDEEQSRTLFCNNLDERVTEEILYEVFLQAGPIDSVRIPLDIMGRQRNFGFVTYQHKIAVPFALELYQGLELFQRKVMIKQQCVDKAKITVSGQAHTRNSYAKSMVPAAQSGNDHAGSRLPRHSIHDGNPFDRTSGYQNRYKDNNDRRRSDSAMMNRKRHRGYQQHQHNTGGNRHSDQRYSHSKRRLI